MHTASKKCDALVLLCSNKTANANGMFNVSKCYTCHGYYDIKALPAVLSFPHFLYGHSKLHHTISGLHPNEKKHGAYIDVHAVSFS